MFTALTLALLAYPFPDATILVTSQLPAHVAQRSLGAGAGGACLFADDPTVPTAVGAVWFEGTGNLIDGLDVLYRVMVGVGAVKVGAPTSSGAGVVGVLELQTGLRYFFHGELLHPFLGGQVSILSPFIGPGFTAGNLLAGPGAHVGVEVPLGDAAALTAAIEATWFIGFNAPQRLGLTATASVNFAY
jgi:hypothetical protein